MKPQFIFYVDGAENKVEYKAINFDDDAYEIVYYISSKRHSFTTTKVRAQDMINRKVWILTHDYRDEKEDYTMHYDVKQSYLVTLHHFLQSMRQNDFFREKVDLDVLTILLGESKELEKKVQRVIEEHLMEEGNGALL